MEGRSTEYIMVFTSHNRAVFLYDRLIRKKYRIKLVSTPCEISKGCSHSIRFRDEDFQAIKNEANKNNITPRAIYKIVLKGNKESYELI